MIHPERWQGLRSRYEDDRPRRMLALDGGGIRGLLTLGILERIEAIVRERERQPLHEYFDYIAGTSTGAIIAAGVARGLPVQSLIEFYTSCGEEMFEPARLVQRLKNLYTADPLKAKLQEVFGAQTDLGPESLKCLLLLLVVAKNVTTDSPWPISSNPDALFNDPSRPDCNLRIPLWQLVRASTAAPVYFPPEILQIDPSNPNETFDFVDGGVTPYNNPAFLMYRMAPRSPRIVSIGAPGKIGCCSCPSGRAPRSAAAARRRQPTETFSRTWRVCPAISCTASRSTRTSAAESWGAAPMADSWITSCSISCPQGGWRNAEGRALECAAHSTVHEPRPAVPLREVQRRSERHGAARARVHGRRPRKDSTDGRGRERRRSAEGRPCGSEPGQRGPSRAVPADRARLRPAW